MSTPNPGPRSPSSEDGSVVWILMLGSALIALVAAQTRKGTPAVQPAAERVVERRPPQRVAPSGQAGARSHSGRAAQRIAETQPERGRAATNPTEITAAGWKDVAVRTFLEFNKDRVLSVAAGVTFYTLLSLFPAVAALVSCYGLFADVNVINDHLASLQGVLPSGAIEIIGDQVKRIAAKGGGTLGLTFFTSLVLSLWSANAAMKAMFDALNVVYEEEEKRSFVMLNLRSLTFTVGALVFTIFALASIVVLPVVFNFIGISAGAWYVAALRWPALVLVLLGGLSLLYRYGPSRERARWRWVGVGSVVAGLLWLVASLLFSWYVASFGNYNETYGSLGAVIGFMTWIWISSTIVLLGGEINAEIEHQTGQDTTTGAALPLGEREARMADTVGAAA
ncbi:YihY/virulence factor BrkB family protein [Methylobacterium sp. E-025]|jgi:membrane protein|uniref:YihY/virulence factor BrkB family protein n=1 Tax=unclassified Methylobacterium TaxID=2615210 RepID=UPI001FB8991A|nr:MULTISPECIES: YihY/virulence factor BrkB family protein [unclassified Methylobacterium]MCJ2079393.1 YihY/virulence factor BrkB family protein [Methylobacterium sp. E-016]MCJ2113411.1 YihY/virulence factor BrkB family protein [Methylobacterium sp. E-025]